MADSERSKSGDGERVSGSESPGLRPIGRFQVIAELGRGSTSIVYLGAVNGPGGFSKLLALKQLRTALAKDPALVDLFLAEARVGAQLSHPNIVATLEIDESESLPYIVMEYLDGQTLQNLVATARMAFLPLPLHMHLAALSGALEGLGHAHAALGSDGAPLRVVHRDVSPHNVFVTSSGVSKLLDFGGAQTGAEEDESPVAMPNSAARVAYLSPEQASGSTVDARSDLFAMGVMTWEAVTRKRFWSEEASKADILRALTSRELPSTRVTALAKSDEALRAIALKATSPEPGDRYQTAAAFQADLRAALRVITPPTFDLSDLGKRLATVFATDRQRLQVAIDAQREAARTCERGERVSRLSPPANPPRTPSPPSSFVPPASPSPSSFAPQTTRASSGPLPSFPLPDAERAARAHRRNVAAAGLVLAILFGAIAASVFSANEAPQPSGAAAAVVPPTEALVARPTAEAVASVSATVAFSETAPAEAMPSSPTARLAASARSGSPESDPAVLAVAGARARVVNAPMPHAASVPPDESKVSVAGSARKESPIRISDGPSPLARSAHPIDSMNPYGP